MTTNPTDIHDRAERLLDRILESSDPAQLMNEIEEFVRSRRAVTDIDPNAVLSTLRERHPHLHWRHESANRGHHEWIGTDTSSPKPRDVVELNAYPDGLVQIMGTPHRLFYQDLERALNALDWIIG